MTGRTFDQLTLAEQRQAGILQKDGDGWEPQAIAEHYAMPLADVQAILEERARRIEAWQAQRIADGQIHAAPDLPSGAGVCLDCAQMWIRGIQIAREAKVAAPRSIACPHLTADGNSYNVAFLRRGPPAEWDLLSNVPPQTWNARHHELSLNDGLTAGDVSKRTMRADRRAHILRNDRGVMVAAAIPARVRLEYPGETR